MSLQMVRFRTDNGTAAEFRSHLVRAFAALRTASPLGVVCTAHAGEPGPDFILALETEEAAENPMAGLPQAAQLRDRTGRAVGAPVLPGPFTVVGSYGS
ncbi:hypothetical protein AB0I75_02115 [Streptomyces sp. NPDC050273]|uniref:hypothetical protein n=1 Tax=Streptomyces sp. NPDC050273 TaxID=3154933 RepID=UPI003418D9F4